MKQTLQELVNNQEFIQRHIGPDVAETEQMLSYLGLSSLDELLEQTVPNKIRLPEELAIPDARSEQQALEDIAKYAQMNQVCTSYIGMGYYPARTPTVILRNVLENPGWYTAYTPYQPEIAQGRLEAILTYQQMTIDLTGMELASYSMKHPPQQKQWRWQSAFPKTKSPTSFLLMKMPFRKRLTLSKPVPNTMVLS